MRLMTLGAVSCVSLSSTVVADDLSKSHMANGSELLSYCAKGTATAQTACLGYIAGVSDAIINDLIRDKESPIKACIPRSVTAGDRAAMVIKWLSQHSDQLRKPAATLVVKALSEAYPCRRD
jgi:hypothetical protein